MTEAKNWVDVRGCTRSTPHRELSQAYCWLQPPLSTAFWVSSSTSTLSSVMELSGVGSYFTDNPLTQCLSLFSVQRSP